MAFKPYNHFDYFVPFPIYFDPLAYPQIYFPFSNLHLDQQIQMIPLRLELDPNNNDQTLQTRAKQQSFNYTIKKEETHQTYFQYELELQTIKVVQNKTKDLMRPFARMLYSHFKKSMGNLGTLDESQIQEIKKFNTQVQDLRSKQPYKFTQTVINFLKTASKNLRDFVEEYVNGEQFSNNIIESESFKHWKNRIELVEFLRKFIIENQKLLKPTKFYKSHFKRIGVF